MKILLGNKPFKGLYFMFNVVCLSPNFMCVLSISLKVKENVLKCFKIMNKLDFGFIVSVSSIFSEMSQFSKEVCDFIGCQFALESSYGRSNLAQTNHNYCGMKNPLVRISTALHAGDGVFYWAQFHDLYSCCVDYLLCLQYHRPISTQYDTISHFSAFIKKFYCPDLDYIDKINKIYQSFKSFKS